MMSTWYSFTLLFNTKWLDISIQHIECIMKANSQHVLQHTLQHILQHTLQHILQHTLQHILQHTLQHAHHISTQHIECIMRANSLEEIIT